MLSRRITATLSSALLLLVCGAVWVGVTSCARAADKEEPKEVKAPEDGTPAPEITLDTLAGKKFSLSAEKGNVVVLDFWATWCPPCRKGLPHLQALAAHEALTKSGLKVVAVNIEEAKDREKVQDMIKEGKFTFDVALDVDQKAVEAYGVKVYPTTIIIGRDGKVAKTILGLAPDGVLEDAVKFALQAK